ncbi:MAG: endonuclease NucS [Thermoplasmatales archaeon]|nr:endonuclease NucS [Thermoplasmatales archaeon]
MHHIISPSPLGALDFAKHHCKPKKLLIVIGDCLIEYRGRAKSLLDWGERIVIIKQDGAVIVHQPVMREPVNWQPSNTKTDFSADDKKFIVNTYHKHPNEKMKLTFRNVQMMMVTSLKDNARIVVSGMETDIVEKIMEKPDVIEEGLRITKREKQTKSGMIDLYGYDKKGVPVIIEVKRSLATIPAVHQLRMYVNDIKRKNMEANIRGILCAPRISKIVKNLLEDYGLEYKEFGWVKEIVDKKQRKLF